MKKMNSENDKNFSAFDIREKERQRIARDLHDVSLQSLAHLVHKIELSSLYIDKDPVRAKLELATVQKDLRQVINDMRTIIYDMHPMSLDDLGLKETIERMVVQANKKNTFSVVTEIEDIANDDKFFILSLFRMIQECYYNAINHSEGNKIFISLKTNHQKYIIEVKDNGKGFDIEKVDKKENHFGLSILQERVSFLNGKIDFNSSKEGTLIMIEIPFQ